jgi:hypothetical protein
LGAGGFDIAGDASLFAAEFFEFEGEPLLFFAKLA